MKYSSLRSRINALPEPERSFRRALYTDDEWLNSWELTAWDHQLPPTDEEWRVWTLIGPPGTGKTEAGLRWVQDRFFSPTSKRIAVIHSHRYTASECVNRFLFVADKLGLRNQMSWDLDRGISHPALGEIEFHNDDYPTAYRSLRDVRYSYVWGDDVTSAEQVINSVPGVRQYVFTQPVTLPLDTLLSKPKGLA